ncbi:MAG: sigma-70 family RNA polymerase sigma factor [Terriglobales bacterium]|jgi:RNA polymerase sigma-70 factor (ECF subfamily)
MTPISMTPISMTMISDEALMLEFQSGSREAFAELFVRYRGPLYGFFRRRLNGDPSGGCRAQDRAEDLMQETFLAVIRATARYEPRALVRTYLYGIAMNLLAAERRRIGRDSAEEVAEEPATSSSPEAVLWVRQALARLDDGDREILMLREYEQLSYAEIAELVKAPLNTVRSRLFRARMALRECLEPGRKAEATATETPIQAGSAAAANDTESRPLTRAEREVI